MSHSITQSYSIAVLERHESLVNRILDLGTSFGRSKTPEACIKFSLETYGRLSRAIASSLRDLNEAAFSIFAVATSPVKSS